MRALLAPLVATLLLALPALGSAQVATPNPVVERLEPTSGPPGTVVQMIGRNFRSDQSVALNGAALEVRSRLPNRWVVVIPEGATSGRLTITLASGTAITGPEFRVTAAAPPPTVTAIDPATATVGSEVHIRGENFSPRATDNTVTLNGLPVVVRSASPTELVVLVPTGAANGAFVVRVAGSGEVSSPPVTIVLGLTISSFTPTVAAPGMQVTIAGSGFATRATNNRVFLGSERVRIVSVTATSMVVEVPERGATGNLLIEVTGAGRVTSSAPLTVRAMPTITAIDPVSGVIGATVHVRGTNFGTDIRAVRATMGETPMIVRAVTDTDLTLDIPTGATTAPVTLTIGGLPAVVSSASLTVLVPLSLASFAPTSGPAGTEVVITGAGFSTVLAENRVTLAGLGCEIVAATPTELRVRTPEASSGPFAVEVLNAGSARTRQPFVITTPPVVSGFEPVQGLPGTVVRIAGTAFGSNRSLVEVTFGGVAGQIRSLSPTAIEVVVPPTGVTGPIAVTVRLQGTSTSSATFRVLPPFTVAAVAPASAYTGQQITVRGTGFGVGTTVRFAGVEAPAVVSVTSATELRAYVPEGATSGPLTVRVDDGREATANFELAPLPEGTAIGSTSVDCRDARHPERAGRTCRVTIRGYGLGTRSSSRLSIVGSRARVRVVSVTPTTIVAEVPRATPAGVIHLEIRGARGTEPVVADSPSTTFE